MNSHLALRFTIRDVFWLTVVVSILALWAMERRWVSHDWPRIHRRDGQLNDKIAKQAAAIQSQAKAGKYLYSKWQAERDRVSELERKLRALEKANEVVDDVFEARQ
jgi:hypothetical protein